VQQLSIRADVDVAPVIDGSTLRYRATKRDCDVCAFKMRCCPHTPARQIPRDLHEDARDVARALAKTEAYEQSRRERKKVEMDTVDITDTKNRVFYSPADNFLHSTAIFLRCTFLGFVHICGQSRRGRLPSITQGRSRMHELCVYGSVRGRGAILVPTASMREMGQNRAVDPCETWFACDWSFFI